MSVNELVDHTFVSWVVHREEARKNKLAGQPRPWSADWVVAGFRFCNVHREDDRGTIAVKRYFRDPYNDYSDPLNLFQMIVFSRMINKVETFERLHADGLLDPRLPPDWEAIAAALAVMVDRGDTVFSGAYMVASTEAQGMRKTDYAVKVARNAPLPDDLSSRQGCHASIVSGTKGLGSFLAGQIVADLSYTNLLSNARDHRTWAPLGPGAAKGANLARGRTPNKLISHKDYLEVGQAQLAYLEESGAVDTLEHRLTLHDVASNVNCETYKYQRLHSSPFYRGRKYK